jgi:SAM-dependent methyltransferase
MEAARLKAIVKQTARRLGLARTFSAASRAYSDEELIGRTEEFNEAAERYWREVGADPAARRHAFNKPLSTVQDTPGMFYRLGLVLDALDLGVGMTVLDFGAGSCWLSSCLNRLRCRTIAMDVSRGALALGREMFEMDPRHLLELEPQFLPYDGHKIDLPDASVDRIVMFDAFHHVPNQEEVLAELFRVLRPGGRAVFGEPGEGHSHTDQSVFEAETTGVLENDLDVADVEQKARTAGFTKVLLKPYPSPSLTLSAADYRRLIDGESRLFPMEILREDLRHFYVFVLLKGEPRHDSRNPKSLRAEITVSSAARLRGRASTYVPFGVTVRNTGDTVWLHEVTPVGGYVMLGGHLFGEDGRLVSRGHLRAELPRELAPGETAELEARLLLPARVGPYRLRLDMVDEFVAWFEQVGSKGVDVAVVVEGYCDSREPHQLKASLEAGASRLEVGKPGEPMELALRVTNLGDTAWLHTTPDGKGVVAIGGHLLSEAGELLDWDYFRTPLPRRLDPGESEELRCRFPAPPDPGRYTLRLDLLAEQVGWFESWGSGTVGLPLDVGRGVPDSSAPGRLTASLELVAPGREVKARVGERLLLRLGAVNRGNTIWLHEARPDGGQVRLGAQLWRGEAELLDRDYHRVSLPADVPPGGSCEIRAELPAPATPGAYRIVLDLVAEGRTWFGSKGSPTLELRLDVGA